MTTDCDVLLIDGGPFLPVHWGTFSLAMHAWEKSLGRLTRACSHYVCKTRCEGKRPCARRKTQAGREPGEALQRSGGPFLPQPEGNGHPGAPLYVAFLAETPGLCCVKRLDWRPMPPVRACRHSVNRP